MPWVAVDAVATLCGVFPVLGWLGPEGVWLLLFSPPSIVTIQARYSNRRPPKNS